MMRKPLFLLLFLALIGACSRGSSYSERQFVGKWKSSKASTPIRLLPNGEWELMANDGTVKQYGVWQSVDDKIMWSVIVDNGMHHEKNPILSASRTEFKLSENDRTVTTFTRMD